MQTTRERGKHAESIALTWLQKHGYQLIEANYSRRIGEIDLIVQHPNMQTIVFVEVRYRSQQLFGGALESVNYRKQVRIKRTANVWLQKNASSMTPARIDVIAICPATAHSPPEQCWQSHQLNWIINAIEE